jgi:hypothetical protein
MTEESEAFRQAPYLMIVDDDVFLQIDPLFEALKDAPQAGRHYFGQVYR